MVQTSGFKDRYCSGCKARLLYYSTLILSLIVALIDPFKGTLEHPEP